VSLVVCEDGSIVLLDQIRNDLIANADLRLFKNNHTPSPTDTLADFVEADFDGYAPKTLTSWAPPYINGSGKAEIDEINRTFTQTGVGTTCDVYGYYVTKGGLVLLWAELDPSGPVAMNAIGKSYTVFSRLTLVTE